MRVGRPSPAAPRRGRTGSRRSCSVQSGSRAPRGERFSADRLGLSLQPVPAWNGRRGGFRRCRAPQAAPLRSAPWGWAQVSWLVGRHDSSRQQELRLPSSSARRSSCVQMRPSPRPRP